MIFVCIYCISEIGIALSKSSVNFMGSTCSTYDLAENLKQIAESGLPGLPLFGWTKSNFLWIRCFIFYISLLTTTVDRGLSGSNSSWHRHLQWLQMSMQKLLILHWSAITVPRAGKTRQFQKINAASWSNLLLSTYLRPLFQSDSAQLSQKCFAFEHCSCERLPKGIFSYLIKPSFDN